MITFEEVMVLAVIATTFTMIIWDQITKVTHKYHNIIQGMLYGMLLLMGFLLMLGIISKIAWRY